MEQLVRVYNEKDRRTLEWLRQESWRRGYYRRGRTLRRIGKARSLLVICQYLGVRAPAFPHQYRNAPSPNRGAVSRPHPSHPRRVDKTDGCDDQRLALTLRTIFRASA